MMMLHCGGKIATEADIRQVPLPERTKTYMPVGHGDFVDLIENAIGQNMPTAEIVDRQLGLGRDGKHLFALWELSTAGTPARLDAEGDDAMTLCVGGRNSYDKSMSAGVAGGGKVFVCDNLAFEGSDFVVTRRHTTNVWRDLRAKVQAALARAPQAFTRLSKLKDQMKAIPLELDDGYRLLGLLQGHGVLRSGQTIIAFKEWDEPTHEVFAARNLWSLYNCCTEALKKGQAGNVIERHAGLTAFCRTQLPPITPDHLRAGAGQMRPGNGLMLEA